MSTQVELPEHEHTIAKGLAHYQPRRIKRYAAVHVLLLSWKDDDIGVAKEIKELADLFNDESKLGYQVWPYQIPSLDPAKSLSYKVAQFLHNFDREENLIIVYYGGHGGPKISSKSPCTWAAKSEHGSPELDWSLIQPQLFVASSDVLMLLDCCYAGQAARDRPTGNVELLAATDKDKQTPTGYGKWPSFTHVLMSEMQQLLNEDGLVTIPALQRRMVQAEAGLQRQPFYVCLSGGAGAIKLTRADDKDTTASLTLGTSVTTRSLHVELSFFDDLDLTTAASLIRWMTRDSPSSIENIRVANQVLQGANKANAMAESLLSEDFGDGARLLPFLSAGGQKEAQSLLSNLRRSLTSPHELQIDDSNVLGIIKGVEEASKELVTFVTDSLSQCTPEILKAMKADNPLDVEDLRSRIAMRLTLMDDEPPENLLRVNFQDAPSQEQRLRPGTIRQTPVLVEYIKCEGSDDEAYARMSKQIRRISALQSEPKSDVFRCLKSLGYSYETLYGPRFGFAYALPPKLAGRKFCTLDELMKSVKVVPLDSRLRLAHTLCNALIHLHSIGWYHKNIRGENVLIFARADDDGVDQKGFATQPWDMDEAYLIGFDCSRPSDAETRGTVDFSTSNNIYRHPERWGRSARFTNYHDLYALGILLIEIGCWRRLDGITRHRNFANIRDPEDLRKILLGEAMERLVHCAGVRCTDAASHCLKKRDWTAYEDWQAQRMIRDNVLEPLQKGLE